MLRDQWRESALGIRVARTVLQRAAKLFRNTRIKHRFDVSSNHSYAASEIDAAIEVLRSLDLKNSLFIHEEGDRPMSSFARDLAREVRRLNEAVESIAEIDEELAVSFQMEASPVLAKSQDLLLYMKRNHLTSYSRPFSRHNDETHDRQQLIACGQHVVPGDHGELIDDADRQQQLKAIADRVDMRPPS